MAATKDSAHLSVSRDGTLAATSLYGRRLDAELFYRDGNRLLSVSVGTAPESGPGKPTTLFKGTYVSCCPGLAQYDTMPDERGFLMIRDEADETVYTELRVVKGWASELNVMLGGAR